MKRNIFLAAAVVNLVIALSIMFGFCATHGLNLGLFGAQAFLTHGGALAWADVLGASFVFWGIMQLDARGRGVKHLWIFMLVNLFIGLSVALPAYWFVREGQKQLPA